MEKRLDVGCDSFPAIERALSRWEASARNGNGNSPKPELISVSKSSVDCKGVLRSVAKAMEVSTVEEQNSRPRSRSHLLNRNKRRGILAATNKRKSNRQKKNPLHHQDRNGKMDSNSGLITEMIAGIGDAVEQHVLSHLSKDDINLKNGNDTNSLSDNNSTNTKSKSKSKSKSIKTTMSKNIVNDCQAIKDEFVSKCKASKDRLDLVEAKPSCSSYDFSTCYWVKKGTAGFVKDKVEELMKTETGRMDLDKIVAKMIKT